MIFYVIYTIDKTGSIRNEIPKSMRHLLEITESYTDLDNGEKHRKLCGWLTRKQFDRFIRDTCLTAQKYDTLGSLTEFGHLNNIYFDYQNTITGEIKSKAFITPVPQKWKFNAVKRQPMTVKDERQWKRLKNAVVRRYE